MIPTKLVMYIDDEEMIRIAAQQTLELAGYQVECYESADLARVKLTDNWRGVIVTDLKMPGTDGLTFMKEVLMRDPQIPVILISGHADISMAIGAIRDGAYDFLEKPFSPNRLVEVVSRALEKRSLVLDNRKLRAELLLQHSKWRLIGRSNAIQTINQTIENVAVSDADVLIQGETGTGKELVAESLHQFSARNSKPCIAINCGAMPENLFESELFGHKRGAFTGADKDQMGKLEYANGGTFFLDEIESMPINLQIKLLRVLQQRKVQRVGSNEDIVLDLRVIAATKTDLLKASSKGLFREDLYYRLNVITIHLPPLRERKEDIPILFQHFYDLAIQRMNKPHRQPSSNFIDGLLRHDWPGNVRELQNFAERAAIGITGNEPAMGSDLASTSVAPLTDRMDVFEKITIEQELINQKGSITRTYETLGISRKSLYDKMKKYGLSKASIVESIEEKSI